MDRRFKNKWRWKYYDIFSRNKSDLNDNREVSKDEGINKSEKYNVPFLETSALQGDNISRVFEELIQSVYINNSEELLEENKKAINNGVDINEDDKDNNKENKKGCCW